MARAPPALRNLTISPPASPSSSTRRSLLNLPPVHTTSTSTSAAPPSPSVNASASASATGTAASSLLPESTSLPAAQPPPHPPPSGPLPHLQSTSSPAHSPRTPPPLSLQTDAPQPTPSPSSTSTSATAAALPQGYATPPISPHHHHKSSFFEASDSLSQPASMPSTAQHVLSPPPFRTSTSPRSSQQQQRRGRHNVNNTLHLAASPSTVTSTVNKKFRPKPDHPRAKKRRALPPNAAVLFGRVHNRSIPTNSNQQQQSPSHSTGPSAYSKNNNVQTEANSHPARSRHSTGGNNNKNINSNNHHSIGPLNLTNNRFKRDGNQPTLQFPGLKQRQHNQQASEEKSNSPMHAQQPVLHSCSTDTNATGTMTDNQNNEHLTTAKTAPASPRNQNNEDFLNAMDTENHVDLPHLATQVASTTTSKSSNRRPASNRRPPLNRRNGDRSPPATFTIDSDAAASQLRYGTTGLRTGFLRQGSRPLPFLPMKAQRYARLQGTLLSLAKGSYGEVTWSFDVAGSVIESSGEDRKITISFLDSQRKKRRVMVLSLGDDDSFSSWSIWLSRASRSLLELHYSMDRLISKGAFARVVLGKDIHTGQAVAIKLIEKSNAPPLARKYFEREVQIMQLLNHCNIVGCVDVFDSRLRTRIVMEFMEGGTLGDLINAYKDKRQAISEESEKRIMRDILSGVEYLHDNGFIHRDLKPDNCLLSRKDVPYGPVKIADFGLSSMLCTSSKRQQHPTPQTNNDTDEQEHEPEAILSSAVGSPAFVAPEIFDSKYGTAVDIWSCGVILYMMLSGGVMPFQGRSPSEMLTKARCGNIDLSVNTLAFASDSAKSLLKGLLNADGRNRLTAKQALAHPWFCEEGEAMQISSAAEAEIGTGGSTTSRPS